MCFKPRFLRCLLSLLHLRLLRGVSKHNPSHQNRNKTLRHRAFTLLEVLLVLLLLGILLSFGIPKLFNYQQSACDKKLQLQVLNFKIALRNQAKAQNTTTPTLDLSTLYQSLDMQPSSCYFKPQNNGFAGINSDKSVFFTLKNGILECDNAKSAKLHNGESYCDIF